jgi:hypothetical protein
MGKLARAELVLGSRLAAVLASPQLETLPQGEERTTGKAPIVREDILAMLAEGQSLSHVCRQDGMPAWSTVHRWMDDDEEFAGQVTRAREAGYLKRADDAVLAAKTAEDAAKGRLALDAERWYLGKLSNAFSDTKTQKHEHDVKLEAVKRVIYDPRNSNSEGVPAASE